ncbi:MULTISPECIES: aldo/keto reductase [Bifidobacterium]|jgi:predicted oxidoreductase|uniref:Aldo/keto reductase n=1 Tax=Bifidobacterium tibiigranuli TaxID=2172043 RepID=A0A5N6S9S2_9BIFI|nr:aldo/keto reductase [Bifidobacterium tibiigranuli]KAE8126972.1 aldo/keto reductase [Bifidobacterium tibiigranuli]KAE8129904.1 aldo/keto reductase [Bifidobacterium tibiigranuli]MCI1211698.1 aldo/keto reductase [Bifidobacterium tibiigranuli]MCI1221597.1 aldo/keto reductase [Bifidobacterium tibiigranuli]MCI1233183.1 aldo/keto reductase [Bifidobacterium tibiigranuli]
MKYAPLGTSGVTASRVALGVMRINEKQQDEADEIVKTVLDAGVNFFDTADCYSAGESSRRFGQALVDLGVERDSIFVQTKFGIYRDSESNDIARYDFSKKHLVAALDDELENLQTDYVDFVLLHRPDTLVDVDELAQAFNELQTSGKVRHFGVSNVNPWQVELLQSAVSQKLEVNQLQFGLGHTNMIQQEFHVNMEDAPSLDHDGGLLAYSRLRHMTIQAWSPFQFGFFEGVFIDNPKFPELNEELDKLARQYGVGKSAIAVAWILRHPAKMQVLLGSMTPSRLTDMVAGTEVELTAQEWYDLYLAAGNDLP